jgi:phosphoribosylaminoimidazole-succinocarboxamide synthase
MRMQKQIKTRLVQIKQFQNSREPSFDPEIYRNAYLARIAREQQELEDEMKQEIEDLKTEMGLNND